MMPCTSLSDRMPEVALGRSRWTAEEERHLAACADCGAEWALVSAASRLAPRIPMARSAEEIAQRALGRIRVDQAAARMRKRGWSAVGVAAAATVALVIWSQRTGPTPTAPRGPDTNPAPLATRPPSPAPSRSAGTESADAPLELALPELDSLPEEALDSILRAVDDPLARAGDETSLDDAGDLELERALAGLEG